MNLNRKAALRQRAKYIVSDYIGSNIAWFAMNLARYHAIGRLFFETRIEYLTDSKLVAGQIIVPLCWIAVFYYSGYYNSSVKSRLVELKSTLFATIFGAIVFFFVIMINDLPVYYQSYYKLFAFLVAIEFICVYIPRAIITARLAWKIHNRRMGFNTLVVGAGQRAKQLVGELDCMRISMGFIIKGHIDTEDAPRMVENVVGHVEDIGNAVARYGVTRIILAPDDCSDDNLFKYLNRLYKYGIPILLAPNETYIVTHGIKMGTIYASPLIEMNKDNMPEGQKNIKDSIDKLLSAALLLAMSPLFLFLAVRVKKESKGPVFFRQERLGKNGKPFSICKFRTMYVDAEINGPALSSDRDKRITPFGATMRKYRLDELPQFWNVLKGEMSIVGPRPERRFFAEKILEKAPYYYQIYTVKPGITSWAMVKYGYANSVDKMVERLKYDIIYLDNRNLMIDLKIMIYTVKTIITGKGI